MKRNISFYNRDGRWYADLPEVIEAGGTEGDNEMILGADSFLDTISKYGERITLKVFDHEPVVGEDTFTDRLMLYEYNGTGADYIDVRTKHQMWLCEVLSFVFGNFPINIYYTII